MYQFESIYLDTPIVPGRIIDIFTPVQTQHDTALFFIHGNWRGGSRADCHKLMEELVIQNYICAGSDYRLDVNALEQLSDLRQGYQLFCEFLRQSGRPAQIVVCGNSAGAHLAALLALAEPGECGENFSGDWTRPAGLVVSAFPPYFTPWKNMLPKIAETMQKIVGAPYEGNANLYQRLSPIYYVNERSCPVLNLHAANEHMFPLRHSLEFDAKMKSLGKYCKTIVYEDAEHGFFDDVERECQKAAFADLLAFLDKVEETPAE